MNRCIALGLLLTACTIEKPTGIQPDFEMPDDGFAYLPIDLVKQEFDAGKGFYFIDARPTNDYDLQHIEGAYSVPFYEKEDHLYRFPTGVWYVAYCACPHSESGVVANYLMENGHDTVGILDEGYLEWEGRGYPTEGSDDQ